MHSVSINFCGGCNPKIERTSIAQSVRSVLETIGFEVSYNSPDAEFIICLSGCTVSCARRDHDVGGPCVAVAAETIDAIDVDSSMLVTEIVNRVRDHFRGSERC
jgi:hypothetical protein